MFGKIKGIIEVIESDHVMIETCSGISYLVNCSPRTIDSLKSNVGESVELYTETVIREDSWQLLGFQSLHQKEWHRLLMSVQGVGARLALNIIGYMSMSQLYGAIVQDDPDALCVVPGVGKKLAKRIVTELNSRVPEKLSPLHTGMQQVDHSQSMNCSTKDDSATISLLNIQKEASEVLIALGYSKREVMDVISTVDISNFGDASALVKEILRIIGKKDARFS